MPWLRWCRQKKLGGQTDFFMDADDEEPWSGLWQEIHRIDNERSDSVAFVRESADDGSEIPAFVRSERPDNVFQNDDLRNTVKPNHVLHELPERQKSSTTVAAESSAIPRQRKVLARERTPNESRSAGKIIGRELCNVFDPEFSTAEIRPVCRRLLLADVV